MDSTFRENISLNIFGILITVFDLLSFLFLIFAVIFQCYPTEIVSTSVVSERDIQSVNDKYFEINDNFFTTNQISLYVRDNNHSLNHLTIPEYKTEIIMGDKSKLVTLDNLHKSIFGITYNKLNYKIYVPDVT